MCDFFFFNRIPKHVERREQKDEPLYNTSSGQDPDDIGNYEEDLTDQRIEGIETLVEQLSKTVLELNNKVWHLFLYFLLFFLFLIKDI